MDYTRYMCLGVIIGLSAYSIAGQENTNSLNGLYQDDRGRQQTDRGGNLHRDGFSVHIGRQTKSPGHPLYDEGITCFRKFRKKRKNCGGMIKKKKNIQTPEQCCNGKGQGFTMQLNMIRKNKYTCLSCEVWRNDETTPEPDPPTSTSSTTAATPTPAVEDFACFRKFRRKRQECGGPVSKKDRVYSPEECCASGMGFSYYGLNKVGKNKYTCMSCVEWERQTMTTTTVVPTNTTTAPAEWGQWGECSTSCGAGWQSRYRQCDGCDINHYANSQSRPCILNYYCPVDGSWGDWLPWQECSLTCGGGERWRERRCNYPRPTHGGADCEGPGSEQEVCNMQPCPVDGSWGPWARFSQCSASCGAGTMSRTRECNRPTPENGGADCRGPRVNNRKCERRRCALHGGWADWEGWTACAATCGRGVVTRQRQCNRPTPKFGGRTCAGEPTDQSECQHDTSCPVDGGWSEWSLYGRCQASDCSHGHQLRSRSCNSPRPRHRGRMCRGRSVERTRCFNDNGCDATAGEWCAWSDWSECTATCSSAESVQTRRRECLCPRPGRGGNHCPGDASDVQECRGVPECPGVLIDVDLT